MEKVKAIAQAVGLRGSTAANLLASAWKSGRLPELLQKIADKAGGAALKMDELRQATLLGDITKLKSAWEGFRIDIATESLPELRDLTQRLTEWFSDPKNITAAAEKVQGAVTGMKDFWDTHGGEIREVANATLRAVSVLGEIVLTLGTWIPFERLGNLADEINLSPLGRLLNSGPEWQAAYATLEPDYRPNVYEVQGLAPGLTQDHKPFLKGEIIIRDEQSRVAGVSSSGGQVSLIVDRPNGSFDESTPYGATYPDPSY